MLGVRLFEVFVSSTTRRCHTTAPGKEPRGELLKIDWLEPSTRERHNDRILERQVPHLMLREGSQRLGAVLDRMRRLPYDEASVQDITHPHRQCLVLLMLGR